MKKIIIILALGMMCGSALLATAATAPGTVEIDPEVRGVLITDWGYDIKNAAQINGLTESLAEELFIDDRMSVLRVAIWGDEIMPAHPAPGEIDTSYYVYDPAVTGSKKMFTAMKNARDARPDVAFFTSKKLVFSDDKLATSMPAWTLDGNGDLDSEQYARMLADYLRFWEHDLTRKSESFTFKYLGINNEGCAFPVEDYAKHMEVVTNLWALSQQTGTVDLYDSTDIVHPHVTVSAAFTLPKMIGPERYDPQTGVAEVANLLAIPAADATLDLIGTHYYPQWRHYDDLAALVANGNGRPAWNTEVHWSADESLDELENAELALATIFDSIDLGLNGLCWWAYTRTDFKGEIKRAITTSTTLARSCAIDDEDGYASPEVTGSLITRAFREGNSLRIWALNASDTSRPGREFNLLRGGVGGDVSFTCWFREGDSFSSSNGVVAAVDSTSFSATLPANSITLFTLSYRAPDADSIYPFEGDTLDASGNGNDGTPAGGYAFVSGRDSQCLEFNGTDSYVSIPRTVSNEFTIAFWMRADTAGAESGTPPQWWQGSGLVDGEVAGGIAADFGVALRGTNVAFGVGGTDMTLFSQTGMADGQWRHVAATRNSVTGEIELFIDGKSEVHAVGPAGKKDAPSMLRIGSLQTGVNFFNGQLDDVRIYNRVLEAAEIQDLVFFDTPALISETWEGVTPGAWVGTGTVEADNLWTYNGRDRTDWGVLSVGAPLNSQVLGVEAAGSNNYSTDAETPLPDIDPMDIEWITIRTEVVLNAATTTNATETRVFAVDAARGNGYAIVVFSDNGSLPPVSLRVLSGDTYSQISLGAVGDQEVGTLYDVTASFKRVSDSFTQVRYSVLKDGVEWQVGDAVIGKAPIEGSLLEKLECSQQKNAFSYIDDVSFTVLPALEAASVPTYTWDLVPGTIGPGDNAITSGNGTWDMSTGNWAPDEGTNNVAWVNGSDAYFAAASQPVDLASGVTVGGIALSGGPVNIKAITDNTALTVVGSPTWNLNSRTLTFVNDQLNDTALAMASGQTLTVTGATGTFNTGEKPNDADWNVAGATLDFQASSGALKGNKASVGNFSLVKMAGGSTYSAERNSIETYTNNWELGSGIVTFDNRYGRYFTLSGTVGGAGTLRVNDLNGYEVILRGVNTFTGGVVADAAVSGSRLNITADSQLGAVPGSVDAANITLANGGELKMNGVILDSNRGITLDNGGTIINTSSANTYGGIITGTGGLQIGTVADTSGNTLILTGHSDYSDGTEIVRGYIQLGVNDALPTNTVLSIGGAGTAKWNLEGFNQALGGLQTAGIGTRSIANNGIASTVTIHTGGNNYSYSGNFEGTGDINLVKDGFGSQTFDKSAVYAKSPATITINAGSVNWDSPASSPGLVTVNSNAVLGGRGQINEVDFQLGSGLHPGSHNQWIDSLEFMGDVDISGIAAANAEGLEIGFSST
ncbi:MAG: LamG-like jellyroll fold domain-containing protein, partial [Verrucomicrobiota bacterium]|nr:LamG-like jellyroll fold domain-containing protein [Verrucomicrobiota bacterium]